MIKTLILLIFFPFVLTAQTTNNKHQDVQVLIQALHIKNNIQGMVDYAIKLYKEKKTTVPDQLWNNIRNSIDYTSYLDNVISIFDKNYTQQEIRHLTFLAQNAKPNKQPILKTEVKKELYNAGNSFGKKFGWYINYQLKIKGY
jgi:hypothetical protein